jgi:hypothetical protein
MCSQYDHSLLSLTIEQEPCCNFCWPRSRPKWPAPALAPCPGAEKKAGRRLSPGRRLCPSLILGLDPRIQFPRSLHLARPLGRGLCSGCDRPRPELHCSPLLPFRPRGSVWACRGVVLTKPGGSSPAQAGFAPGVRCSCPLPPPARHSPLAVVVGVPPRNLVEHSENAAGSGQPMPHGRGRSLPLPRP